MKKYFFTLVAMGMVKFGLYGQDLTIRQYPSSAVILTSGDTLMGSLTHHIDKDIIIVQVADQLPKTLSAHMVQRFTTKASSTPVSVSTTDTYTYKLSNGVPVNSVVGIIERSGGITPPPLVHQAVQLDSVSSHHYISLPWSADEAMLRRQASGFFEILTTGRITVVGREVPKSSYKSEPSANNYLAPGGIRSNSATQVLDKYNKAPHMYRDVETMSGNVTEHIKFENILYTIDAQGVAQRIKINNKKEILHMFPEKREEIEKYMRDKNVRSYKNDDIIKVIKYINSIN